MPNVLESLQSKVAGKIIRTIAFEKDKYRGDLVSRGKIILHIEGGQPLVFKVSLDVYARQTRVEIENHDFLILDNTEMLRAPP